MWNSTRNTGESLPRELKLKCTRDTPGFHIKPKPSIILRDHEMHLTHLHLQNEPKSPIKCQKPSEAWVGLGTSSYLPVDPNASSPYENVEKKEENENVDVWVHRSTSSLGKISLESQRPSTHN